MQSYHITPDAPEEDEVGWEPCQLGHPLRLDYAVAFFRLQPHGNMATFYFKLADAGILAGIPTDLIILRFMSFLKKERREKLYGLEFLRGITGDMNKTDLAMLYKRMQPSLPPRGHDDIEENPDTCRGETPTPTTPQPCFLHETVSQPAQAKIPEPEPAFTYEEFLAIVPGGSMSAFYFKLFAKGAIANIETDEIAKRFLAFFAESEQLYNNNQIFIAPGMSKGQIATLFKVLSNQLHSCTPITSSIVDPLSASPVAPLPTPISAATTEPTYLIVPVPVAPVPEALLSFAPAPELMAPPQEELIMAPEPFCDFVPPPEELEKGPEPAILNFVPPQENVLSFVLAPEALELLAPPQEAMGPEPASLDFVPPQVELEKGPEPAILDFVPPQEELEKGPEPAILNFVPPQEELEKGPEPAILNFVPPQENILSFALEPEALEFLAPPQEAVGPEPAILDFVPPQVELEKGPEPAILNFVPPQEELIKKGPEPAILDFVPPQEELKKGPEPAILDFVPPQEELEMGPVPAPLLNFAPPQENVLSFALAPEALELLAPPQEALLIDPTFKANPVEAAAGIACCCADPSCVDAVCKDAGCAKAICGEPSCSEAAPAEASPIEGTAAPLEASPIEAVAAPVEASPIEAAVAPLEASPIEAVAAPLEASPIEAVAAPLEASPIEAAAAPVEASPIEAAVAPVEASPIEAAVAPVEASPIEAAVALVEASPIEAVAAPVEASPIEAAVAPVEASPIETAVALVEASPIEAVAALVEASPIEAAVGCIGVGCTDETCTEDACIDRALAKAMGEEAKCVGTASSEVTPVEPDTKPSSKSAQSSPTPAKEQLSATLSAPVLSAMEFTAETKPAEVCLSMPIAELIPPTLGKLSPVSSLKATPPASPTKSPKKVSPWGSPSKIKAAAAATAPSTPSLSPEGTPKASPSKWSQRQKELKKK